MYLQLCSRPELPQEGDMSTFGPVPLSVPPFAGLVPSPDSAL